MKIMHLLTSSMYSGAENVCINLMKIAGEKHDVYYVSLDGPIRKKLVSMNLKFYLMKSFSVSEVTKAIKTIDPDIIHAHDIRASVYSSIFSNCTVISHIHGKFNDMSKPSIKSILYLISSFRISKILYVSKSIYDEFYFKKILDKKGEYLPNRIDTAKIQKELDKYDADLVYDLIYIGRLEEVKNPIKFLNVVKTIQTFKKNIKACMIGDGHLRSKCLEKIKIDHLNVDMLGFQENPLEYLKKSKIVVMTSISEGLPMVSLEALAANKPIVSTPTDGMKELIVNYYNGALAQDENEIAEICLELLTNEDKYQNMVGYIRDNTKNDFDNYRKYVMDLYDSINVNSNA